MSGAREKCSLVEIVTEASGFVFTQPIMIYKCPESNSIDNLGFSLIAGAQVIDCSD